MTSKRGLSRIIKFFVTALSSKASVPAWPHLPFGMNKIAAFEAAVEWKAVHINDKEVPLPDDNWTKEMIQFINGEK